MDNILSRRRTGRELINLEPTWSAVPVTLGQLTLGIPLFFRQILLAVPADVLGRVPHGEPEALHVMASLGIDMGHVAQEEFLKDFPVEFLRVLLDGLPACSEEGTGLETD